MEPGATRTLTQLPSGWQTTTSKQSEGSSFSFRPTLRSRRVLSSAKAASWHVGHGRMDCFPLGQGGHSVGATHEQRIDRLHSCFPFYSCIHEWRMVLTAGFLMNRRLRLWRGRSWGAGSVGRKTRVLHWQQHLWPDRKNSVDASSPGFRL